ncbi:MAG: metal-sensitive transcriptional regulator [Sphingomonadaceae bacterium]|nr:metal-sensitive transcriptional regulator [Sphingomonadaceae bacterium]
MASDRKALVSRLNRIAGQVGGIARMIDDGRYCIDVLTQIQATKAALAKVESQVLKDHAATCVAEAIASGDEAEQRDKFNELIELMERQRR